MSMDLPKQNIANGIRGKQMSNVQEADDSQYLTRQE